MSDSTHPVLLTPGTVHQSHLADALDGLALQLGVDAAGTPLLLLSMKDEQGHQADIYLTAAQLSTLVQTAMARYLAMRWQSTREVWLDIRPQGATKWHLSLCQHAGQGHLPLCRHVSTRHPDRRHWEAREAGTSLWDGHVCHSCTWLWMEQAAPALSLNALLPFLVPPT